MGSVVIDDEGAKVETLDGAGLMVTGSATVGTLDGAELAAGKDAADWSVLADID